MKEKDHVVRWGHRELQERASPSGVFAQSERNMKAQAFKGKKRGHKRDMSGTH